MRAAIANSVDGVEQVLARHQLVLDLARPEVSVITRPSGVTAPPNLTIATPPMLKLGAVKPVADELTLEAIIANRYEVMARYARELRLACKAEIAAFQGKQGDLALLKTAKRWMPRDDDKVPESARPVLAKARAAHPVLDKMVTMREELRQLWLNTSQSREQLAADLQAWCRRAEESGIAQLQQFSMRLRAARA